MGCVRYGLYSSAIRLSCQVGWDIRRDRLFDRCNYLRAYYVQLNARDRHYRDAMPACVHALKSGSADTEVAEVASARRTQRDARAEAQMIASDEVLAVESRVNNRLATHGSKRSSTSWTRSLRSWGRREPSCASSRASLNRAVGALSPLCPQHR